MKEETKIERLIAEGTPFAVARIFFSLAQDTSEGHNNYTYLFLEKNRLKERAIDEDSVDYLKRNIELFDIKVTEGGKVYDFNDFQGYFKSNASKRELKRIKEL
jgi:hypothetical protein